MATRICPTCKENLPESSYQPSAWRKGQGNSCRDCATRKQREYRTSHREEVRQRESEWYHSHKDRAMASHRKQKYGIEDEDFWRMFQRQNGKCLGCAATLNTFTSVRNDPLAPHIDHDHETGEIRGLLCRNCNSILGFARDDKVVLRRMLAYLSRNPQKYTVYIAGSLKNPEIPEVAIYLREKGFEVRDEWHGSGPNADDHWQEYEKRRGRSYEEALQGVAAENTYLFDRAHIDMADSLVLVMPGGKSSFLELGYAVGQEKPTFILLEEEMERFEVMPRFVQGVCRTREELLSLLEVERDKYIGKD